jgi:hypothetical protein
MRALAPLVMMVVLGFKDATGPARLSRMILNNQSVAFR